MNAALVFTYGRAFPGREAQAFDAFQDALTFFGKLAADGKILEPEVFIGPFGKGVLVIKGDRDQLRAILDLEDFMPMYMKAAYAVPDIGYEIYSFGEEVIELMGLWSTVGKELGYV